MENDIVTCWFCERKLPVDTAIDDGWIPTFWDGDGETGRCVCPECTAEHLRFNPELCDYETFDDSACHQ